MLYSAHATEVARRSGGDPGVDLVLVVVIALEIPGEGIDYKDEPGESRHSLAITAS